MLYLLRDDIDFAINIPRVGGIEALKALGSIERVNLSLHGQEFHIEFFAILDILV